MSDDLLVKAKEDFIVFVHVVWKFLKLPPPTEVQIEICKFVADDSHGDSIVEAYRGAGKSYVTSAYVVWKLWSNPNLKFLIISANSRRADAFSLFCFQLLTICPFLTHLKPTGEKGSRSSLVSWDVADCSPAQSASVTSKGITSLLQGDRADIIIFDDVESMENSATNDQREKLMEKMAEFDSIKKAKEGQDHKSRLIGLGTPQTFESIYHKVRGYKVRIFPARYPDEALVRDYEGRLCPVIEDKARRNPELVGLSTDPKRFTDEDLLDREMKVGKSKFQLQFMLNTALSDAEKFPLKLQDLIVMDLAPDKAPVSVAWSNDRRNKLVDLPNLGFSKDGFFSPSYVDSLWNEYEGSIMSIDPAGRGSDDTSYAVIKYLHGMLFLVDAGGFSGGYDNDSMENLAKIAKRNNVSEIIIESNFGDGMYSELFKSVLRKFHRCGVEEVRHNTQKEVRIIDTLEPVMNQHRLVVTPSVIHNDWKYAQSKNEGETKKGSDYSLFYQLTHITKDKGCLAHDDALDALAIAVAHFTEMMARDAIQCEKDAYEKHLDDQFERVYEKIREREDRRNMSGDGMSFGQLLGNTTNSCNFLDNI